MKKISAFAATNRKQSINKRLLHYALSSVHGIDTELLDLNDFALPLFSVDLEAEIGQQSFQNQPRIVKHATRGADIQYKLLSRTS